MAGLSLKERRAAVRGRRKLASNTPELCGAGEPILVDTRCDMIARTGPVAAFSELIEERGE